MPVSRELGAERLRVLAGVVGAQPAERLDMRDFYRRLPMNARLSCGAPACSLGLAPPACSLGLAPPACSLGLAPPACSLGLAPLAFPEDWGVYIRNGPLGYSRAFPCLRSQPGDDSFGAAMEFFGITSIEVSKLFGMGHYYDRHWGGTSPEQVAAGLRAFAEEWRLRE